MKEMNYIKQCVRTLMDVESKIEFEENYNTFKEDYEHIAIVMRYVT